MKPSTLFYLFNFVLLYTSALSQTIRLPLQTPQQPKTNLKRHKTRFSSKIGSVPIYNLLAAGYKITDQLDLGGLVISDFPMILAHITHSIELKNYDGILGLALGRHKPGFPTILEKLKADKLISEGSFSMYLGNDPDAWGSQTGELIFGGYDPKYAVSEFQFVNVRKETEKMVYWSADLMGLGYGTEVNVSASGKAPVIFDSGTSLLILPQSFVNGLIEQGKKDGVGCQFDRDEELYKCDCSAKEKLKELVFYFDGVALSVPTASYIYVEDGSCYLAMQIVNGPVDLENPIVLGDVFLKNFYTMYNADNYTVGFAQALPFKKSNNNMMIVYGVIGLVVGGIVIGLAIHLMKKRKMQKKKMYDNSSLYYSDDWSATANNRDNPL